MDLARVPVQAPFVAEVGIFTAWNLADMGFDVLCFVFPKNCAYKCLYVLLKEDGRTVRQSP
jgi:hypothetical protein